MSSVASLEPSKEGATVTQKELGKDATEATSFNKGWRFWAIFVVLCLLSFVSALDSSVIVTALPTITKEIGGSKDYVWIANSFVLASSAPQPLFGQISNIFGRRWPMSIAVILFALGSGISGGASSPGMLIAGRSVMGVGAGGIYVLLDIICCDLVPLRQRGQYLGIMFSFAGLGATIGPLVGGAFALANWRWIFYINIPICGVALAAIISLLNLRYARPASWTSAIVRRVDWTGNAIFVAAMFSILYALITGGVQHPWSSYRIIVPLILGFVGWGLFHIHQSSALCAEPSIPARLFSNRTSAAAYMLTFLNNVIVHSMAYFVTVYFQGVRQTTALKAGINFLPYAVTINFWAVIAGVLLSKIGKYKILHAAGFALSTIGSGLFILLDERTSTVKWVWFQIIASAGTGFAFSVLLPAIMAALPESDVAVASSTYSFVRTFGQIWGITIAGVLFNNGFNRFSSRITDVSVRAELQDGAAYSYAAENFVNGLVEPTKSQVQHTYVLALRSVWWLGVAASLFGFFVVFIEREIPLRQELDTEFGIDNGKTDTDVEASGTGKKPAASDGQVVEVKQ